MENSFKGLFTLGSHLQPRAAATSGRRFSGSWPFTWIAKAGVKITMEFAVPAGEGACGGLRRGRCNDHFSCSCASGERLGGAPSSFPTVVRVCQTGSIRT